MGKQNMLDNAPVYDT